MSSNISSVHNRSKSLQYNSDKSFANNKPQFKQCRAFGGMFQKYKYVFENDPANFFNKQVYTKYI